MSISFVSIVVLATLLGMGTYTSSQQTSDTTDRVCSYSLTSPSDVDGRCPHLKQAVGCRERTDVTDDDAVREEIEALKTSLQSLRDEFEEWKRDCPCNEDPSSTALQDVDGRCPHLKQAVGCRERTDVTDGDSSLREEIEALKTSLQALRDEFEERKRQCLCDTDEDEDASPPEAFHVHSSEGTYKLNFAAAAAECIKHSARMASYDELYAAWENGLNVCAAGWLSDGSVRYPMQTASVGCGSSRGIQSGGFPSRDNTYDVYCIANVGCK